jgi:hypothetical protein
MYIDDTINLVEEERVLHNRKLMLDNKNNKVIDGDDI